MDADDVVSHDPPRAGKEIASPLASRVASVESATAVDPQTRRIEAEGAVRAAAVLARHHRDRAASVETNKDALQKTPVGTGPFKFQEWQPNGFILLAQA